jgi:hypothetical protein
MEGDMARKSSGSGSKHSSNQGTRTSPGVSESERQNMIAETAYFRALARGFQGGSEMDDWLIAERQINRLLPSPKQQKRELAAYEALRREIGNRLADVRETLNADTVHEALQQAREKLKAAGEYAADTVDRVGAHIEKDIVNAAQRMGPKWDALSEKSADLFSVWRDRSNIFLARAAQAVADWLERVSPHLKPLAYEAGDIAAAGSFQCTSCGERLILRTSAHLPPCAKCQKTEFQRV